MSTTPRKYNVMVARFPGNNQEHPDSSGYVLGLAEKMRQDPRIGNIIPWRVSDTPITMCRNLCVREALAQGADYLLMIDSDMSPDCEPEGMPFWGVAWNFLMDRRQVEEDRLAGKRTKYLNEEYLTADAPIPPPATIAAPYCGPPPTEPVYVFRWKSYGSGDPDRAFKLEMVDRDMAAQETGIEEVAALPTGLILYDVRVFQKLPPPWFDYEWKDEPYRTQKASTEDVFQTRNASIMGLPQFVAWDCWAGHLKLKKVCKPCPLTVHAIRKDYADAVLKYREKAEPKPNPRDVDNLAPEHRQQPRPRGFYATPQGDIL